MHNIEFIGFDMVILFYYLVLVVLLVLVLIQFGKDKTVHGKVRVRTIVFLVLILLAMVLGRIIAFIIYFIGVTILSNFV
ncbi:hypothetical protein K7I13_08045 [Brucepastera parasyntrophica]|uniref:hypothetical protein n=1 Tax=Brucepastera parasyntrophica TaxID=2880008 RepID=UPI00210AE1F6|nr:hypothetical protein [Brucepastera parasyntrophica]ULQ58525.1 hypothetical protein K7I13_08045 [Brucepastera parasyntrophica]